MKKRYCMLFSLISVLFAFLIGLVLLNLIPVNGIQAVRGHLNDWRPFFTVARLMVIGSLVGCWPGLVTLLSARRLITANTAEQLQRDRWRIFGWLCAIELMLGQSLFAHLLPVLQGTKA